MVSTTPKWDFYPVGEQPDLSYQKLGNTIGLTLPRLRVLGSLRTKGT